MKVCYHDHIVPIITNINITVAVIDNVGSTCVLICQHLSEPLFDLVLKILYDYATSHVRPNALRAIHQLVECLAIADPQKTLERFVPHCIQHIRTEIEHGASSLRYSAIRDSHVARY
jgi:proteasome activator subunit 4